MPQRENPPRIAADGFLGETIHFEQNTMVDRTGQADCDILFHRRREPGPKPRLRRVSKGAYRAVPTNQNHQSVVLKRCGGLANGRVRAPLALAHRTIPRLNAKTRRALLRTGFGRNNSL
jgi:hypothetical protein